MLQVVTPEDAVRFSPKHHGEASATAAAWVALTMMILGSLWGLAPRPGYAAQNKFWTEPKEACHDQSGDPAAAATIELAGVPAALMPALRLPVMHQLIQQGLPWLVTSLAAWQWLRSQFFEPAYYPTFFDNQQFSLSSKPLSSLSSPPFLPVQLPDHTLNLNLPSPNAGAEPTSAAERELIHNPSPASGADKDSPLWPPVLDREDDKPDSRRSRTQQDLGRVMSVTEFQSHVHALRREYLALSQIDFQEALQKFGIPAELGLNPGQLLSYFQYTAKPEPLQTLLKTYAFLSWFPLEGHVHLHLTPLMIQLERAYGARNDRYYFYLAMRTRYRQWLKDVVTWYPHGLELLSDYIDELESVWMNHNFRSFYFAAITAEYFYDRPSTKAQVQANYLDLTSDPVRLMLQKYAIYKHVFRVGDNVRLSRPLPQAARAVLKALSMSTRNEGYYLLYIYPSLDEWLSLARADFFTTATLERLRESMHVAVADAAELLTALNRVRRSYEREQNRVALLAFYNLINPIPSRQLEHYLGSYMGVEMAKYREVEQVVDDEIKTATKGLASSLLQDVVGGTELQILSSFSEFVLIMQQELHSASVQDKLMQRWQVAPSARPQFVAALTEMVAHYGSLEHQLPSLALYEVLFELSDHLVQYLLTTHFKAEEPFYEQARAQIRTHLEEVLQPIEREFDFPEELRRAQDAMLRRWFEQEDRFMNEVAVFMPAAWVSSNVALKNRLESFYTQYQPGDQAKMILLSELGIPHVAQTHLAELLDLPAAELATHAAELATQWRAHDLVFAVKTLYLDDLTQRLDDLAADQLALIHYRLTGEIWAGDEHEDLVNSIGLFRQQLSTHEDEKLFLGYVMGLQQPEFFDDVIVLSETPQLTTFDELAERLPQLHSEFLSFHLQRERPHEASWQSLLQRGVMLRLPSQQAALAKPFGISSQVGVSYFVARVKWMLGYLWQHDPLLAAVFILKNLQMSEMNAPLLRHIVAAELPHEDADAWISSAATNIQNIFTAYLLPQYHGQAALHDDLMITLATVELHPPSLAKISTTFHLSGLGNSAVAERLRSCAPGVLTERAMVYSFYTNFTQLFNADASQVLDRKITSFGADPAVMRRQVFHRLWLCLHGHDLGEDATIQNQQDPKLKTWLSRTLKAAFADLTDAQLNQRFNNNDAAYRGQRVDISKAQASAFMEGLSKFHQRIFLSMVLNVVPASWLMPAHIMFLYNALAVDELHQIKEQLRARFIEFNQYARGSSF